MSNTQEAIKLLKELEDGYKEDSHVDTWKVGDIIALLEAEPEPTEFTKKLRGFMVLGDTFDQAGGIDSHPLVKPALEACDLIDAQTAELASANDGVEHGNEVIEELIKKNGELQARIKELEQALKGD